MSSWSRLMTGLRAIWCQTCLETIGSRVRQHVSCRKEPSFRLVPEQDYALRMQGVLTSRFGEWLIGPCERNRIAQGKLIPRYLLHARHHE